MATSELCPYPGLGQQPVARRAPGFPVIPSTLALHLHFDFCPFLPTLRTVRTIPISKVTQQPPGISWAPLAGVSATRKESLSR